MSSARSMMSAALALPLALAAGSAPADEPPPPPPQIVVPKFEYAKKEEIKKKVEWKASAAAGLTLATGNSNVVTVSGGANASRNDGRNKVAIDVNGVYSRAAVPAPDSTTTLDPTTMNLLVKNAGQIDTGDKLSAGFLVAKLRYDRFFTANNAVYFSGYGGFDIPASKQVNVGGQLGYARQLVKTPRHELMAELGADLNFTEYTQPAMAAPGAQYNVFLGSARAFLGYNLILGDNTRLEAKAEALVNLNSAAIGDRFAGSGEAPRIMSGLALTTKIWQRLSFRFSTSLRYDSCPGLNTVLNFISYTFTPSGNNVLTCVGTPNFAALGSTNVQQDQALYQVKYNRPLDTLTEANLVFNFL